MTDVRGEHDRQPVWGEQAWTDWSDYADTVRVEVRFKEWPGAPDLDEVWVLYSEGAAWPRDWLSHQLGEIAAGGDGGCCGSGTFLLDVREHHVQWGASAAAWEAILTLSQDMLSNGTWVGIVALGRLMQQRLAQRHGEWVGSEAALVDEEVRAAAVRKIVGLRVLPSEELVVRSVETAGKNATTVEVSDPAGGFGREL